MSSKTSDYHGEVNLKTGRKKQLTNNTYKEIYIRLMLDTIKSQILKIKAKGRSVYLLNAIVKGAEKFLNHIIKNAHDMEKATSNLEILKRSVNAMRNLCIEIEKTNTACNLKVINRLLLKNFRIFFPCNAKTRQLFKGAQNGVNDQYEFFNGLIKIPSIKFLSKLIKKALSKEILEKFFYQEEDQEQTQESNSEE